MKFVLVWATVRIATAVFVLAAPIVALLLGSTELSNPWWFSFPIGILAGSTIVPALRDIADYRKYA
jgi:hypothetical protein